MSRRHAFLLVILAVGGLPSAGLAQPIGRELRVNSYTTGDQEAPSISSDGTGTFVVVWQSAAHNLPDQDGSGAGIFGQRYDSNQNLRLGPEFQVNTYTTDSQRQPSVSSEPGGNFVVVWESYGQDGSGYGIFGQRFGADGSPLGGEFRVNSYTTESQRFPSVSSDPAGNFVVVWESHGQDGSDDGVFAQRFDADGSPLGGEFPVNTYTTNVQGAPAVASGPAGNFIVVWERGSGDGIFGQRYLADGSAIGGEFQVNTNNKRYGPELPAVAANESGFVVVWGTDGGYYFLEVSGQRYDSDGNRRGNEFLVNRLPEPRGFAGYSAAPQVAYDGSGNFLVVGSYGYRTTDWRISRIFERPYDAGGHPLAPARPVNLETVDNTDSHTRVAAKPDGDFLVVWSGQELFKANGDIAARRVRGQ